MGDSYITAQFLTVIQFLIYFKRIVNRFLSIFTMSYNNYFTTLACLSKLDKKSAGKHFIFDFETLASL